MRFSFRFFNSCSLILPMDLRKVPGRMKMEVTNMAWPYINVEKNVALQGIIAKAAEQKFSEGKAEGRAAARVEMLRGLLLSKLRQLPKWAGHRFENATKTQIERWASKMMTARSLEGVIGKK